MYGAYRSPNVQAFQKEADDNILVTWAHLTESRASQCIRAPTATTLGHMEYKIKNELSTKNIDQSTDDLKEDKKPRLE